MTRLPRARSWARLAGITAAWICLVLALTAGRSEADRVRTTKSTKVYKRTGEQSGVVTKVAAGKTLTVVAKQGRWLKVRVNGRTGWVTQSSVVALEARDVPRNTRRRPFVDGRSTRRGWSGGAPEDRVGGDAVEDDGGDGREASEGDDDDDETGRGSRADDDDDDDDGDRRRGRDDDDDDDDDRGDDDDDDADDDADTLRMVTVTAKKAKLYPRMSKKAKPLLTVKRGAQLIVLDEAESGKWIRVEDDEGAAGWILADAVGASDGGGDRKKRAFGATTRLGFAQVGGKFTSTATAPAAAESPPPDYDFGSTAVSLAVGGELVMAYKKDYFLGAGLDYLGCVATPGIRYAAGMMAEDIGFKTHDIDVRLLGGYDFHKKSGMTAWVRLGYHYGVFAVGNLNNLAKIPAETFKGPTFGVSMRMPRLTKKIGAEAALDAIYPGSRKQTQGIEDGAVDKAQAATINLLGMYDWKGAWKLGAGYRLGYAATKWTGASVRVVGADGPATSSKRTDISHVVTVGLNRAF